MCISHTNVSFSHACIDQEIYYGNFGFREYEKFLKNTYVSKPYSACKNHIHEYKNHTCECLNHTMRVEITTIRVKETLYLLISRSSVCYDYIFK
jgi:hypothetical protein